MRQIQNRTHEPLPQPNPVYEPGERPTDDYVRPIGGLTDTGYLRPARASHDGSLHYEPSDAAADAFGRHRQTAPTSVFDNKQLYAKDDTFFVELLAGGGATAHLPNEAACELSVGTNLGDRAVRQTRQYLPYHPGQSQLLLLTGVLGPRKAGVVQRIGYYDDTDGFFFLQDEEGLAVVRRSSTSGVPVEEVVRQQDWDMDTLDGLGRSQTRLDPERANIFILDMAWLGVGALRFGVQIGGRTVYCHKMVNENRLTTVHTASPVRPLRFEIENVAATSSPTAMKHICSAAFSEGAEDPLGLVVSDNLGVSGRAIALGASLPLLAIRPLAGRERVSLEVLGVSAFPLSADDYLIEVWIGGVVTGGVWVASSGPSTEINKTGTSFNPTPIGQPPAVRVFSRYGATSNQTPAPSAGIIRNALQAGAAVDASWRDPVTLLVTAVNGASYLGSLTWKELA